MTTLPRPWSPPHQAQYPQPPTDPRGVENYLASQAQPPQYYDPYAQSGTWQPTPPHPPYAARQASLPIPSVPQYTHGYGHHQQPTDASVEALDLAEYSARLNAQQAQYYTPPPQPSYYTPPASYPAQPASAPPASQPQSSTAQPQSAIHDFIDIGPFSYTGIRETSPPPVRPPPAQPQPQPRQTREPSPVHSPPPRGHLPWASETNERDLGDRDPDPVFPPSSPHRNDSHNFPFNVQAESAPTATSETLAHSAENDAASGYRAYDSPDPESHEPKKDWGVTEGERPGDVGADGKLISNGPRKRMALRALEVVAAIGSVVACIYAFAVPKPNPAAPPASKPAVYVIVVLGFATIFVFAYVYIIRGLFGVGRPKDDAHSHAMVLPISRHRANSKKNKQSSVQVNLIVDPSYFSPKHEITPGVPWTEQQKSNAGVFTSYERERARLSARKGLWWALGLDVLGALAWGTAFVLAMIGPRCPAGGYSGWCDAFNGAVACACIGCALFVVSGVLVGRDLMVSRRSDRKLGRP